jgi:hypothetical protein
VKQSSGGMARGKRKWETRTSAGKAQTGKDHSTWGGGHRWRTVTVASPSMVLHARASDWCGRLSGVYD